MIIKVFLLAGLALASWWVLKGKPTGGRLALARISSLLIAAAWIVGVLFPDTVSWAAHAVGVREAPSLVLYVLVVVFTLSTIAQRLRVQDLEDKLARLTRAHALLELDVVENKDAAGV
ncbi:DUF2304 domain-containing protein [Nocardioides sp. CER19]|uniref:DUF2304 domain-containing protein n=1 Tax=Nocardioides sp. CER19 TaxID=3038538 RepID=UPI002449DE45|nr:DUF2304 domain-containing protein [Nocardioides sp. CER19]MDH2416768.1 DUF2304 domain-containing protein [Nocardioides sp. CER19]